MDDVRICPKCKSQNVIVVDSRPTHGVVRRRVECVDCEARWSTYEIGADSFKRFVKANKIIECLDSEYKKIAEVLGNERDS